MKGTGISDTIRKMNQLGKQGEPFVFLIDFEQEEPLVLTWAESLPVLRWITPTYRNCILSDKKPVIRQWRLFPVSYDRYREGFDRIREYILRGDTYLLNYTQPTRVGANLNLSELFELAEAPFRVYLKDRFVCFSPEWFVRIDEGKISSFPMKGTIDATLENARENILANKKEIAEHHTIVDLIRNDLGSVANEVRVEKFRYTEQIKTNRKELIQVSSRISGQLPDDYPARIGDIIFELLPAGSVTGAPKPKTVQIIREVEGYRRGFYTGIFGVFDGRNLESAVLIRYIEKQGGRLVYKSGGGVTFLSDCRTEYEELINKVYVPIAGNDQVAKRPVL
jgi:para-aminobenzoate synthetase component 1